MRDVKNNVKYFGMPINERLIAADLQQQFAESVRTKNTEKMIEILLRVEYQHDQAIATAKTFMANPDAYKVTP